MLICVLGPLWRVTVLWCLPISHSYFFPKCSLYPALWGPNSVCTPLALSPQEHKALAAWDLRLRHEDTQEGLRPLQAALLDILGGCG